MNRTGWRLFSGITLMVVGVMRILDAIWAFRYKGTVVDKLQNAVFGHSLKTYGWIWLVVGIVLILAGFMILAGGGALATISRWIGVAAAAALAITAVSWLPYYPVWSLLYAGLGIGVIYALLAHYHDPVPAQS